MAESEKILVVDDESVIRELLIEVLRDEGYEVDSAEHGMAALEIIKKDSGYILLITDLMMPEMDGIELIRNAKKLRPEIIPIVMTGFATIETARAAVQEGAYDYVLKPFSISEVRLAVANAIERHRLVNENARLREVSKLSDISDKIATIRKERDLLDYVLRVALERVEADEGAVMVIGRSDQTVDMKACVGLPEGGHPSVVHQSAALAEWVVRNGQALCIKDVDGFDADPSLRPHLHHRSLLAVPLESNPLLTSAAAGPESANKKVLAVLCVYSTKQDNRFDDGDLKTLTTLANHAVVALDNTRLIRDIEETQLSTLRTVALLLEAKDAYTHGHSERVRDYSMLAAKRLGLPDRDVEILRTGAALHDIGKVGVNDAILNKQGRPTEEEWNMIRRHPEIGYGVLEHVRLLSDAHLQLVRSHHERVDGKGYPDGLKADELPTRVRIITIADAYDAMSSNRAYRKSMPEAAIIEQIEKGAGHQFDAGLSHLFIELIRSGELGKASS